MDRPLDKQQRKTQKQSFWRKVLFGLITAIAIWLLISSSLSQSINRQDIRTAKVVKGNLDTSLAATGIVVPLIEETIASKIDSQIRKVFIEPGQKVVEGTRLMQLDTTKVNLDIANIREEIALKENQIQTRILNLNKTHNDSNGRLALLRVDLDSRKTRHARLTQLAESGATSAHDLKEASLNVKRTEIEIQQLKQSIFDNKAATETEIEGIKLEKSILEKSLNEKERLLGSATILAPISGEIVWLKSEEGSSVSNGESLLRIADSEKFKIEISLSDYYAEQISQGMRSELVVAENKVSGKITSIYAGETQGVLKLVMILNNTEQTRVKLRQKQRVEVNLITGRIENTLLVDKGQFANGAGTQEVFVIKDELATKTKVLLGASNRDFIQVKSGLNLGEEIITSDTKNFLALNQIDIDS